MPGALHRQHPANAYQVIDIAHLGYFNSVNEYGSSNPVGIKLNYSCHAPTPFFPSETSQKRVCDYITQIKNVGFLPPALYRTTEKKIGSDPCLN